MYSKGFAPIIVVLAFVAFITGGVFYFASSPERQGEPLGLMGALVGTESYGWRTPFYTDGNISFEFYWPQDEIAPSISAGETEILVFNEGKEKLEIKNISFAFILEGQSFPIYSGTWEKFPSRKSWDRTEYVNIGKETYSGAPLKLLPGEKGKIHYHLSLGNKFSTQKSQQAKIVINYSLGTAVKKLEKTLIRGEKLAAKPVAIPARQAAPSIKSSANKSVTQTNVQQSSKNWPLLWGAPNPKCEKKKSELKVYPIAVKDITLIQPMGELAEGHVVPGEHIGINYAPNPNIGGLPIYAPADGYIATVERHQYIPEGGFTSKLRNYHVYLVHSCNLFTGFVHVTNLAPEILAASKELKALDTGAVDDRGKNVWPNVKVKAGQMIGTANGFGLLGMVTVDLAKKINGYINPANYADESWRLNSVAPFDYFPEPLKSQILAKNARKAEPRGGKFDLDVDGTLLGNWFESGSGGIKGNGAGLRRCGNFPCPAQDGQIAFIYDYVDPKELRVSIGHNWGLIKGTPYGVKGNGPDFRSVDQTYGLVKYELARLLNKNAAHNFANEHAIYTESDNSTVYGTLLVQVIGTRRIKVEVFPNVSAANVTGFTANARTYER